MALALAAGLAGCATKGPESVLREGPRMIDLYRGAAAAPETDADVRDAAAAERRCRWWLFSWPCALLEADAAAADAPEPSYTRTAANELELLFPRLPNPDVYIYVVPHLATESRLPVPGYTTAVPLHDRVEYALPGEVNGAETGAVEASP